MLMLAGRTHNVDGIINGREAGELGSGFFFYLNIAERADRVISYRRGSERCESYT